MPDMTMLTPTLYADNDLTIYHAQAIKQRWLEGLHQSEGDVTPGFVTGRRNRHPLACNYCGCCAGSARQRPATEYCRGQPGGG